MKGSWPKVQVTVTTTFAATHSLPLIGVAEPHEHEYRVSAGWLHEINPQNGCTDTLQSMRTDLEEVVTRLRGKHLNDVLPFPPTAEIVALWILAQLTAEWSFVEVAAYGDFAVRADGDVNRGRWANLFRTRA